MERRREPRYSVEIRVDYASRDAFVSNYVMNISNGGLFIKTKDPLPLGAELDLTLHLPELGRSLTARGRVVWTYDVPKGTAHLVSGMGIRFEDLSAEGRSVLEAYLARLSASGVEGD